MANPANIAGEAFLELHFARVHIQVDQHLPSLGADLHASEVRFLFAAVSRCMVRLSDGLVVLYEVGGSAS